MSYFYTQDHVQLQPHRGLGQRHASVDGGVPNQRDVAIEREIGKMTNHPGKFADLQNETKSHAAPRGVKPMRAPGYTGDNVILPQAEPRPMLRVFPERSETELRALLRDDNRKERAQDIMIKSPGYIAKMTGHSSSPLTKPLPMPHPGVKPLRLADTGADVAPDGFRGMGSHSHEMKMYGRRAPSDKDFRPAEFQPKRRTHGVKSNIAPRDTLVLG